MKPRPRTFLSLATAATTAALAVAGCGGDGDGDGGGDPASIAPATAPVWVEGSIRPEGALKENTEAAIETVSGIEDPGDQIVARLNDALEGDDLSYEQDIEPWLGERAGIYITGFEGDVEDGAAIIETTDEGAAEDFLATAAEGEEGIKEKEYEGVSYRVDDDGFAGGIVEGFLVFGDETAFKETVDASGGESLADSEEFSSTIEDAPEESLVDVYVSVEEFAKAVQADLDPETVGFFRSAIGEVSGKTALASLIPDATKLELDFSTNATGGVEPGDTTPVFDQLPADAWAAIAVPGIGEQLRKAVDQAEAAGLPRALLEQQLTRFNINLESDILRWPKDLALFVSGTDLSSLAGALLITSSDPSASQNAVRRLTEFVRFRARGAGVKILEGGVGVEVRDPEELGPKPLQLRAAGDKVVLGYGEQATQQTLQGGGAKLSTSPTFEEATATLGEGIDPTGYVAVGPVLELAESLGAGIDPDYEQAKPFLQRISYVVFGAGVEDELATAKFIVGLEE